MITEITDEEVAALTQGVLTRYGIDFTCYEPKSLKRRIIKLLNTFNFESIHHLWLRLLNDNTFVKVMMNEISVGMTSMFRDPIFWIHMRQLLFQRFSTKRDIHIWHAGCSTGEEVHSMGILLHETKLAEKAKAVATDFNVQALEVAQRGEYHKIKMLENEKNYAEYNHFQSLSTYTEPTDGKHVRVRPELTRHVTYRYHNLVSDAFTEKYDIIFCRNVMIYFDNPTKEKLVKNFFRSLHPGGYLAIGFYDVMLPVTEEKLFSLVDGDAKIFQRMEEKSLIAADTRP